MSELLKEKLQQLGFPVGEYSLYSLRSGGATTAAKAEIPDRVLKRHGLGSPTKQKMGTSKIP